MINEKRESQIAILPCVDGKSRAVEVVHGVVANHRLSLISRDLWRQWALYLPPLHRLAKLAVREGRVTSIGLERIILLRSEGEGTRWWLTIGFDR